MVRSDKTSKVNSGGAGDDSIDPDIDFEANKTKPSEPAKQQANPTNKPDQSGNNPDIRSMIAPSDAGDADGDTEYGDENLGNEVPDSDEANQLLAKLKGQTSGFLKKLPDISDIFNFDISSLSELTGATDTERAKTEKTDAPPAQPGSDAQRPTDPVIQVAQADAAPLDTDQAETGEDEPQEAGNKQVFRPDALLATSLLGLTLFFNNTDASTPDKRLEAFQAALSPDATDLQKFALKEIVRDAVISGDAERLNELVKAGQATGLHLGGSPQMKGIQEALAEVGVEATWTTETGAFGTKPKASILTLKLNGSEQELKFRSDTGLTRVDRSANTVEYADDIKEGNDKLMKDLSDKAWQNFKDIQLAEGRDNRFVETHKKYMALPGAVVEAGSEPPPEYKNFVRNHSYSVIPNEAISQVVDFIGEKGGFELGAGTGHSTFLINEIAKRKQAIAAPQDASASAAEKARGTTSDAVIAYDLNPVESGQNNFHDGRQRSWTDVHAGSEYTAGLHPDKTMIMAWPPHGKPFASKALTEFADAGGERFVYIGPGSQGNTGDAAFFEQLHRDWVLEKQIDLPHWYEGRDNRVQMYVRKPTPDSASDARPLEGRHSEIKPQERASNLAGKNLLVVNDTAIAPGSGVTIGGMPERVPATLRPYVDGHVTVDGAGNNSAVLYRDEFGGTRLVASTHSEIYVDDVKVNPNIEIPLTDKSKIRFGNAQDLTLSSLNGSEVQAVESGGFTAEGRPIALMDGMPKPTYAKGDAVILAGEGSAVGRVRALVGDKLVVWNRDKHPEFQNLEAPKALADFAKSKNFNLSEGVNVPGYTDITELVHGAPSSNAYKTDRILIDQKTNKVLTFNVDAASGTSQIVDTGDVRLMDRSEVAKPRGSAFVTMQQADLPRAQTKVDSRPATVENATVADRPVSVESTAPAIAELAPVLPPTVRMETGDLEVAEGKAVNDYKQQLKETVGLIQNGKPQEAYTKARSEAAASGVEFRTVDSVFDLRKLGLDSLSTTGDTFSSATFKTGTNNHTSGLRGLSFYPNETANGTSYAATESRTVVVLPNGTKLDVMKPDTSLDGGKLSAEEKTFVDKLLATPEGKAMQERHAFTMAGGVTEIEQYKLGGKCLSKAFVDHVKNSGGTLPVFEGFDREFGLPQVVQGNDFVFAMAEAGMTPENLNKQFHLTEDALRVDSFAQVEKTAAATKVAAPQAEPLKVGEQALVQEGFGEVIGKTKDGNILVEMTGKYTSATITEAMEEKWYLENGYEPIDVETKDPRTGKVQKERYLYHPGDPESAIDIPELFSIVDGNKVPADHVVIARPEDVAHLKSTHPTGEVKRTFGNMPDVQIGYEANLLGEQGTFRHYADGVVIAIPEFKSGVINGNKDVRLFSVDGGKSFIPMTYMKGWYYLTNKVQGQTGEGKFHHMANSPEQAAIQDRFALPLYNEALSGNPKTPEAIELSKLILSMKIKDPMSRDPRFLNPDTDTRFKNSVLLDSGERFNESQIAEKGYGTKQYTVYTRTVEDARKAAKIMDDYLARRAQQEPGLIMERGTKTGLAADGHYLPGTNRISLAREAWPLTETRHADFVKPYDTMTGLHTADGPAKSEGKFYAASVEAEIGPDIRRYIQEHYGVEPGNITQEHLDRVSVDAGAAKGFLTFDLQGKLCVHADDVKHGNTETAYLGDGNRETMLKESKGLTGRHAIYSLYEMVNPGDAKRSDPLHFAEVQEAAAREAFLTERPSRIRNESDIRLFQNIKQSLMLNDIQEFQRNLHELDRLSWQNRRTVTEALERSFAAAGLEFKVIRSGMVNDYEIKHQGSTQWKLQISGDSQKSPVEIAMKSTGDRPQSPPVTKRYITGLSETLKYESRQTRVLDPFAQPSAERQFVDRVPEGFRRESTDFRLLQGLRTAIAKGEQGDVLDLLSQVEKLPGADRVRNVMNQFKADADAGGFQFETNVATRLARMEIAFPEAVAETKGATAETGEKLATTGNDGNKPPGGTDGDKPPGGTDGDKPPGGTDGDKPPGDGDKPPGDNNLISADTPAETPEQLLKRAQDLIEKSDMSAPMKEAYKKALGIGPEAYLTPATAIRLFEVEPGTKDYFFDHILDPTKKDFKVGKAGLEALAKMSDQALENLNSRLTREQIIDVFKGLDAGALTTKGLENLANMPKEERGKWLEMLKNAEAPGAVLNKANLAKALELSPGTRSTFLEKGKMNAALKAGTISQTTLTDILSFSQNPEVYLKLNARMLDDFLLTNPDARGGLEVILAKDDVDNALIEKIFNKNGKTEISRDVTNAYYNALVRDIVTPAQLDAMLDSSNLETYNKILKDQTKVGRENLLKWSTFGKLLDSNPGKEVLEIYQKALAPDPADPTKVPLLNDARLAAILKTGPDTQKTYQELLKNNTFDAKTIDKFLANETGFQDLNNYKKAFENKVLSPEMLDKVLSMSSGKRLLVEKHLLPGELQPERALGEKLFNAVLNSDITSGALSGFTDALAKGMKPEVLEKALKLEAPVQEKVGGLLRSGDLVHEHLSDLLSADPNLGEKALSRYSDLLHDMRGYNGKVADVVKTAQAIRQTAEGSKLSPEAAFETAVLLQMKGKPVDANSVTEALATMEKVKAVRAELKIETGGLQDPLNMIEVKETLALPNYTDAREINENARVLKRLAEGQISGFNNVSNAQALNMAMVMKETGFELKPMPEDPSREVFDQINEHNKGVAELVYDEALPLTRVRDTVGKSLSFEDARKVAQILRDVGGPAAETALTREIILKGPAGDVGMKQFLTDYATQRAAADPDRSAHWNKFKEAVAADGVIGKALTTVSTSLVADNHQGILDLAKSMTAKEIASISNPKNLERIVNAVAREGDSVRAHDEATERLQQKTIDALLQRYIARLTPEISRGTVSGVLQGIPDADRAKAVEYLQSRARFLSRPAMSEQFTAIQEQLRLGGYVSATTTQPGSHGQKGHMIRAYCLTSQGEALAQEFRKMTGLAVEIVRPGDVIPKDSKVVLFDSPTSAKATPAAQGGQPAAEGLRLTGDAAQLRELTGSGTVFNSEYLTKFNEGLNSRDLVAFRENPQLAVNKVRKAVGVADGAVASTTPPSDAQINQAHEAVNKPIREVRDSMHKNGIAHLLPTDKPKKSGSEYLQQTLIETATSALNPNIVDGTRTAHQARLLHDKIAASLQGKLPPGQTFEPGKPIPPDVLFVTINRNAAKEKWADSAHKASQMFREANGYTDASYDANFVTPEQLKVRMAEAARQGKTLQVFALNDSTNTGGEARDILERLNKMKPAAKVPPAEVHYATFMGYQEGINFATKDYGPGSVITGETPFKRSVGEGQEFVVRESVESEVAKRAGRRQSGYVREITRAVSTEFGVAISVPKPEADLIGAMTQDRPFIGKWNSEARVYEGEPILSETMRPGEEALLKLQVDKPELSERIDKVRENLKLLEQGQLASERIKWSMSAEGGEFLISADGLERLEKLVDTALVESQTPRPTPRPTPGPTAGPTTERPPGTETPNVLPEEGSQSRVLEGERRPTDTAPPVEVVADLQKVKLPGGLEIFVDKTMEKAVGKYLEKYNQDANFKELLASRLKRQQEKIDKESNAENKAKLIEEKTAMEADITKYHSMPEAEKVAYREAMLGEAMSRYSARMAGRQRAMKAIGTVGSMILIGMITEHALEMLPESSQADGPSVKPKIY